MRVGCDGCAMAMSFVVLSCRLVSGRSRGVIDRSRTRTGYQPLTVGHVRVVGEDVGSRVFARWMLEQTERIFGG